MKKIICIFLVLWQIASGCVHICLAAPAVDLIESPYGVLMESSTGTVIYEKDKDVRRSPASITKIMTLILIYDALADGSLTLDEMVTTSAYAKSMGGSQVFLEEGEQQTVETMIKCIVIASGNDASVAMAEHLSGSEAEFVSRMNQRAEGLGMVNTHFEDCCGLTDSENHFTTAYDVALMSCELVTKYPEILTYSSIWMQNITHVTAQGTKEFSLTNTNKLIRSYDGCVGLKTGSTSSARYCVSAVANRDHMTLIAVIMAAPDYKVRFKDAAAMLNYGYGNCRLYQDTDPLPIPDIRITGAVTDTVGCSYDSTFSYLLTEGGSEDEIECTLSIPEEVRSPVRADEKAGEAIYTKDGREIGRVDIVYKESVKKASLVDFIKLAMTRLWLT